MSASYVSARFEKTDLSTQLGMQRCIVRDINTDANPTNPDELVDFLVVEYVSDYIGERLARIALLADISAYTPTYLRWFEVTSADFVTAGVLPDDVLTVQVPYAAEWTSEEYPGGTFSFIVASVISPTMLAVTVPFPSFKAGVTWSLPARSLSGVLNGTTRREGAPAGPALFLDYRFNKLFASVPELDTFVNASKTALDLLSQYSTASNLTSENYTSRSTP